MDPHSFYLLDPDPHKMNADPQPWFERNCPQSSINHIIVGTNCRLVFLLLQTVSSGSNQDKNNFTTLQQLERIMRSLNIA